MLFDMIEGWIGGKTTGDTFQVLEDGTLEAKLFLSNGVLGIMKWCTPQVQAELLGKLLTIFAEQRTEMFTAISREPNPYQLDIAYATADLAVGNDEEREEFRLVLCFGVQTHLKEDVVKIDTYCAALLGSEAKEHAQHFRILERECTRR